MKNLVVALAIFAASCTQASEKYNFSRGELTIDKKTVKIEIADTDMLRERGLMFRKDLPDDTGMLFIFQEEQPRNFWMKNTFIPLAIGYFDKNKKLVDVQEMTAVKSEMQMDIPQYPSAKPAMYALEMPKGWFSKNGIKPGAVFTFKKDK